MMKDFLLAMFKKSRILCQRKVMLWIAAVVLFVVFPSFVIDFLELLGGLVALIFAARVGMLDGSTEENDCGAPSHGGVYNYATGEVDSGVEFGGLYDD